jgi:endonuclease/exonuclease/phosphatase family metal-dependent hydrolase
MLRLLLAFLCVIPILGVAQDFNDFERGSNEARFVFYNVENLFDVFDDSLKRDEEFTPEGAKHWNNRKYYNKLHNLSKVILSVGGWDLPELVAFCEVENRKVISDLLYHTPLKEKGYEIVHFESPDRRGIDVAFMYLPEKIKVLDSRPIPITFPWDSSYKTRDILEAKLLLFNTDTVMFYVNHWPSKWGGHMETEQSRMYVGQTLRKRIDEVNSSDISIIAMGDFNDMPTDKSLIEGLGAKTDSNSVGKTDLFNLSYQLQQQNIGSHKYQNEWSLIDQVIINNTLFQGTSGLGVKGKSAQVFKPSFLIIPDEKFQGEKTNRTFLGMRYLGGYSDHLPVYIDVIRE